MTQTQEKTKSMMRRRKMARHQLLDVNSDWQAVMHHTRIEKFCRGDDLMGIYV